MVFFITFQSNQSLDPPSPHLISCIVFFLMSQRAHLHVVGMLWFMSWVCPLLFILFLCLILSLSWPFNCISFHKFSRQLSVFSLCSFGLISCLIGPFMKAFLSLDIIPSGWMGSKHQWTVFRFRGVTRTESKSIIGHWKIGCMYKQYNDCGCVLTTTTEKESNNTTNSNSKSKNNR